MFTFSPPLTVNSEAGFGGPFCKSPGRHSPPYRTGISSGLINLNSRQQPRLKIQTKIREIVGQEAPFFDIGAVCLTQNERQGKTARTKLMIKT